MSRRLCVFCGIKPPNKNKEHVLPVWLLELTGDPNRVVKFGIDYQNEILVEFAFDQLVAPACEECNSEFGETLEPEIKPIIEAILNREAIECSKYLLLLDWLDKVRVGLWLNYQLIQKMPFGVEPKFRIKDRIGKKDRMLAIYPIDNEDKGLNAFGVETPLFHHTPSCFGLRINNIIILNMSADFLFSKNCGFPSPNNQNLIIDGDRQGMTEMSDFTTSCSIESSIIERKILKPSVHLYQPIMQVDPSGTYQGGFFGADWKWNSFIAEHTLDGDSGQGVLFRQLDEEVEVLKDLNEKVDFNNVLGKDCSTVNDLVKQIYDLQIYIQYLTALKADDEAALRHGLERREILKRFNTRFIEALEASND